MWLEYFGLIDDDVVFYVFCAIAGIIVILSVVNIFIGCCIRLMGRPSPGASIDFYLVFGAIILTFNVLIQGLNSNWSDYDTYNILCQMYPTTLLIGLTMFIGGLAVKSWSILIFFKWHKKRPLKEEWKPNVAIWLLILIAAAMGVIWVLVHRQELFNYANGRNGPLYLCQGPQEFEWQVATSVWHGLLLLLAVVACCVDCCIACRHARGPITILSVITLNTLACVAAGLCIHFLYDSNNATIMYGIKGALMLWPLLLADILLLIAKVSSSRKADQLDHYDKPDSGHDHVEQNGMPRYQSNLDVISEASSKTGSGYSYPEP